MKITEIMGNWCLMARRGAKLAAQAAKRLARKGDAGRRHRVRLAFARATPAKRKSPHYLVKVAAALYLVALWGPYLSPSSVAAQQTVSINRVFQKWFLRDADAIDRGFASIPTLAFVTVDGADGGPGPHHCSVRIDWANSTIGYGRNDQAYIEWRVRINGSVPPTRTSYPDAIHAVTRYLDSDQHGANCNYLCRDAGVHTFECRVFNGAGENSGWQLADSITCDCDEDDRDPAKFGYLDGSVGSSGDGLSWGAAVKTGQEAVALANGLGDGATIWVRNANVSASTDREGDNVLFIADPEAETATLTFTNGSIFVECGDGVSGCIIKGIRVNGSDAGKIMGGQSGQEPHGMCLWDVGFQGVKDVSNGSGDSHIRGMSHIGIYEIAAISGEVFFTADTDSFLAFGVDIPVGSYEEHTYRLHSSTAVERIGAYHSFQFCRISNSVETGKNPLRWYSNSNCWCFGCEFNVAPIVGFTSPGSSDGAFGTTVSFIACHFQPAATQTGGYTLTICSGWTGITISGCYFELLSLQMQPRNDEDVIHFIKDITVLNCTFVPRSSVTIRWSVTIGNEVTNQVIRNCLFMRGTVPTSTAFLQVKNLTEVSGFLFEGNHFDRTNATDEILEDQSNGNESNFTEYLALGFVGDETRATVTMNGTTLEPDVGLTTGIATAPFPHVSYGGVRYNNAADNFPSGAWLGAGAAGSYPEYRSYRVGSTFFKAVA